MACSLNIDWLWWFREASSVEIDWQSGYAMWGHADFLEGPLISLHFPRIQTTIWAQHLNRQTAFHVPEVRAILLPLWPFCFQSDSISPSQQKSVNIVLPFLATVCERMQDHMTTPDAAIPAWCCTLSLTEPPNTGKPTTFIFNIVCMWGDIVLWNGSCLVRMFFRRYMSVIRSQAIFSRQWATVRWHVLKGRWSDC